MLLSLDCDLIPSLETSNVVLEEVVFDSNFESIEDMGRPSKELRASTETITIDDDEEEVIACAVQPKRRKALEEVEIIKVKFLNEPNDPDIELVSQILSPSEVIDVMRSYLKSVQSLTGLSFTTVRLFMTKYQWIKDQFVNDFFEYGIERLMAAHKLVLSFQMKATGSKRRKRNHSSTSADPLAVNSDAQSQSLSEETPSQELKTCIVCYDESNASDMFGLNCGHILCIECWNQYISQHVNDRSSQEMITCPGEDCPIIVDDEELLAIIREQSVRDRYQRLISNSFVSKNPLLKWCPNGDCLHAVRVKEGGFQDVECVCKTVFCYLCGDRWHEPLSCQQHQNWIQKYASATVDSKSANWLTRHTKCCPKCQFPIEKNGGCNYILCQRCRHQFCYECLGRCSHGRCLKQNAADALSAQSADQKLKEIELRIYPTIKDQYQQQSKQFAIEDKLQKDVSLKLEKAVKCPEFRSALKFIKSAFTVLCHCRQTLMYSYVFGYYLLGPESHRELYIFHLKELERQTSILSRMLTTETAVIQREAVYEIKRVVQPIYKACEAQRSALVQCIKQGLTQNVWQFSSLSP